MHSMIEGVLRYSMINSDEQNIQKVNLNEVFDNIISDLELIIKERSATINQTGLPTIDGAFVLLYQLFYNLINNSLKFISPGKAPVISVTSASFEKDRQNFVEIRIEDNGIGFEPHEAEKIFDTFSRLNSKDQFEGTGLGLSLCKRIVHRHHGTIEAIGKKNEGAIFIVKLPFKQESLSI